MRSHLCKMRLKFIRKSIILFFVYWKLTRDPSSSLYLTMLRAIQWYWTWCTRNVINGQFIETKMTMSVSESLQNYLWNALVHQRCALQYESALRNKYKNLSFAEGFPTVYIYNQSHPSENFHKLDTQIWKQTTLSTWLNTQITKSPLQQTWNEIL